MLAGHSIWAGSYTEVDGASYPQERGKYVSRSLGQRLTLLQTDLEDTAQIYVDIAKNASMTGQRITVGTFHGSLHHCDLEAKCLQMLD